jgi:hypothetical protein
LDVETGLLNFSLYRVSNAAALFIQSQLIHFLQSSNSMKAFEEAAKVIRGLVDGSVCILFFSFQYISFLHAYMVE